MAGILWFFVFQAIGIAAVWCLLPNKRPSVRLWLGSAAGSAAAMWLPVPFAFLIGFTSQAQLLAIIPAAVLCAAAVLCSKAIGRKGMHPAVVTFTQRFNSSLSRDIPLYILLPVFSLLCFVILLNHTITPGTDGLYTGQCTYGDMCMHLGFITSIAEQGIFPPEYSILPGTKLCYPFLCDSVSSSLYVLGSSLRIAYIIPMLFAFLQVFSGFWFLAEEITRSKKASSLAFLLFFLNGGMGFVYFFSKYNFHELFTGYYITPTNLIDNGIRWVNVIADMLIPQRATLFGWAALIPCLYLLFCDLLRDELFALPAGIAAGFLPMIHTHSYLALGIIAFCWLLHDAADQGFSRKFIRRWLSFGFPAILIALPQLFEWTLQSASGNSQFLRIGIDWVNNGSENWFLFWFKNIGLMFFIIPLSFVLGKNKNRIIALPGLLIFAICEVILFQPNPYDNNKLMYVGYMLLCITASDYLISAFDRIHCPTVRHTLCMLLVALCSFSAILTLAREIISGTGNYSYQLFSSDDVAAAEYIKDNTNPDSVFLTADNHNNTVAVLTGRNIMCGSPSYLYYHGLNYQSTLQLEKEMLSDPQIFEQNAYSAGIDYVFIGSNERIIGGQLIEWLDEHYNKVFSSGDVSIYKIS